MSEEEKTTEAVIEATPTAAVESSQPPLLKLKEENPKVFYGGIAAVVAIAGIFMMSGGDDRRAVQQQAKTKVSIGETYTLQAVNALTATTLKILKIPGQMASFDNDDDILCNAPTGSKVIAREFQSAFGTQNLFVKVEMVQELGDCRAGVKGWTLTANLK